MIYNKSGLKRKLKVSTLDIQIELGTFEWWISGLIKLAVSPSIVNDFPSLTIVNDDHSLTIVNMLINENKSKTIVFLKQLYKKRLLIVFKKQKKIVCKND